MGTPPIAAVLLGHGLAEWAGPIVPSTEWASPFMSAAPLLLTGLAVLWATIISWSENWRKPH